MSEQRPAGRPVDIRPVQPVGVTLARVPGGLQSLADRLRLRADPDAGVLRWTDERGRDVDLPLPGATSAGLDSLRRVVVVTARGSALYSDPLTRRIVFVGGSGRSLASSVPLTVEGFDAIWPSGVLDPLTDLGIDVTSKEVRNQHQVNRAFPGASRHWRLLTWPWNWMIYASWVVVPAVVLVLLIGFGVIG